MSPALVRALRAALCGIVLCAAAAAASGAAGPVAEQAGREPPAGGQPAGGPPGGVRDHRQSSQDPDPVTSDTLFWCEHLQQNFAENARAEPASPKAAEFARRGGEMCARGRVREGILWLRHAIVLLETP